MPTYEYECEACGLKFERQQPMSAAPLEQCPACRGRVRRVVSGGAGFIVKGGERDAQARGGSDCSLQRTGRTCCGRVQPCGEPACGEDR